jgi:hypothetical protein
MLEEKEPLIIVCVHKSGARPLWYVRDIVKEQPTASPGTLVVYEKLSSVVRTTTVHLDRVNCVDCCSSGYYNVRLLQKTSLG